MNYNNIKCNQALKESVGIDVKSANTRKRKSDAECWQVFSQPVSITQLLLFINQEEDRIFTKRRMEAEYFVQTSLVLHLDFYLTSSPCGTWVNGMKWCLGAAGGMIAHMGGVLALQKPCLYLTQG